jgi:hypothetical protein
MRAESKMDAMEAFKAARLDDEFVDLVVKKSDSEGAGCRHVIFMDGNGFHIYDEFGHAAAAQAGDVLRVFGDLRNIRGVGRLVGGKLVELYRYWPKRSAGLSPAERERWAELREKEKKEGKLSESEEYEFRMLWDMRAGEAAAMLPVPACCEAARSDPAIVFYVNVYGEDSSEVEGHWELKTHEKLVRLREGAGRARMALEGRHVDRIFTSPPEPKFCPYCGAPLPKMRRKNPAPENVCRVEDGGYHCSTCKERLHACLCDPPETAFEFEDGPVRHANANTLRTAADVAVHPPRLPAFESVTRPTKSGVK